MSIVVLLIAAAHAIPIVWVGKKTQRRESVDRAAKIMCVVAIVTGAIVFTLLDLLVIGIAWRWTRSKLPESEQGRNSIYTVKRTTPGARILTPIEQSDLDIEVPLESRKILDAAHGGGFRSYVESIPGWQGSATDHKKASEAMVNLHRGLMGYGEPDYEDPFIAGAYQIQYQLRHCVMAFRIWNALFRVMSEETSVPDRLFVCDVGAGSDAGLIGLMLSLMKRNADPHVRYVSIEPSDAMHSAGRHFREYFKPERYLHIDYKKYKCEDELRHLGKPESDVRIITAFHLSWKHTQYVSNYNNKKDSSGSMKFVMDNICPDIYACTCHENKSESLKNALNECFEISKYSLEKCKIPPVNPWSPLPSPVYPHLVDEFGFCFPEYYDYWGNLEKSRFKTPKDAVLHYGWLTDTEAGFVPAAGDDLPF